MFWNISYNDGTEFSSKSGAQFKDLKEFDWKKFTLFKVRTSTFLDYDFEVGSALCHDLNPAIAKKPFEVNFKYRPETGELICTDKDLFRKFLDIKQKPFSVFVTSDGVFGVNNEPISIEVLTRDTKFELKKNLSLDSLDYFQEGFTDLYCGTGPSMVFSKRAVPEKSAHLGWDTEEYVGGIKVQFKASLDVDFVANDVRLSVSAKPDESLDMRVNFKGGGIEHVSFDTMNRVDNFLWTNWSESFGRIELS